MNQYSYDVYSHLSIILFSEIVLQTPCVIKMTSNQTMLYPPPVMSSMSSDNIKER